MLNRILFVLFAAFWVIMNVLLYRAEFQADGDGSFIPVEVVVEKILQAPDLSSLDIRHRGRRIGFARVSANIGEEYATGQALRENAPLEGEVRKLTSYTLDIEGGLLGDSATNRHRFSFALEVSTNQQWKDFNFILSRRPQSLALHAVAEARTLNILYTEDELQVEHQFTFDELRQPKKLLGKFAGPWLNTLLDNTSNLLPIDLQDPGQAASRFQWKARNDKLQVGQGTVRVYRLEAEPLERQKIVIIVSRVGEILKVELPHGITLVNDEMQLQP